MLAGEEVVSGGVMNAAWSTGEIFSALVGDVILAVLAVLTVAVSVFSDL